MEKIDREFLIKEISTRLPYGIKVQVFGWDEEKGEVAVPLKVYSINTDGYISLEYNHYDVESIYIEDCLLYLRPMSSMTEEEKRHISKMMCLRTYDDGVVHDMTYPVYTPYYVMEDCLSYLRSIHMDYSGLIEKGLAIEAKEGMY